MDSKTEAKPCDGAVGVAQELAHHLCPGCFEQADAIDADELRSLRRWCSWCGGIFRRESTFWQHMHSELAVVGFISISWSAAVSRAAYSASWPGSIFNAAGIGRSMPRKWGLPMR